MSGSRGALAAVAATGALAAASPALGIDMSLRSAFLPPPDGSSSSEALALAEHGREVIVTGKLENGTFVGERNSLVTKCPSKFKNDKSGSTT